MKICSLYRLLLLLTALGLLVPVTAADWPMWRYDAGRSAASPRGLPAQLRVQWVRQLHAPSPAWQPQTDDFGKLQFDASYEPVVMGKTLFVPSMMTDCLLAYDTDSGKERWRYYCDGPVRFAPVAWQGKVYVASDDGYLYCLNAVDGALLWKFRGGPSDRMVLGNERVISMWPARGGPVLRDGVVYFAAGIWPFMGIFIHALDAETGRVVWSNTGSGDTFLPQQHGGAISYAGVSPQGYLAISGDTLLVSGGRTVPAAYDLATGKFRYFDVANRGVGNNAGSYAVSAMGGWFFNGGVVYRVDTGAIQQKLAASVLTEQAIIGLENGTLIASGQTAVKTKVETVNKLGEKVMQEKNLLPTVWQAPLPPEVTAIHLQAGSRLYASGKDGLVASIELPRDGKPAEVSWQGKVDGEVWTMLAADDKLFVITRAGTLYCFAETTAAPVRLATFTSPAIKDAWTGKAADILKRSGVTGGNALVLGAGTGRLAEELARQSTLHIVVVDPDAAKVAALRKRYDAAGLYGKRIAVLQGDALTTPFPPYIAELIVSEDLAAAGYGAGEKFIRQVFQPLRPYGGVAILPVPVEDRKAFVGALLPKAKIGRLGEYLTLTREGALPGSAAWTHQYADAGNTVFSRDTLVKAPLGLLSFGGSSNEKVLPRHGHGPIPHVVGGRLFIEGPDTIIARDVYTGRTLWERSLPGVGKAYDNTNHQPGANALGSNYVSMADGIYVAYGQYCLRLDPATGRTLAKYPLPVTPGKREFVKWGSLTIEDDVLIAMVGPLVFNEDQIGLNNWNATASRQLIAVDRYSGKILWRRTAEYGFRHNAVAAGNGKVFCIDRLADSVLDMLKRRGINDTSAAKLLALDLHTGKVLWKAGDAFGTWLGYAADRDVLLQSGRPSRDMLTDEPKGRMIAYRGHNGTVIWDKKLTYEGPLILDHDMIISSERGGKMFSLLTGDVQMRKHPLTGAEIPWSHSRTYGCGSVLANENLLFFRSGAAGYYDLAGDGGTGNFGGAKSGCTNNMIAADGVLSIPDYTRTCTCSYQLKTSMALVYMPEVETWTWNDYPTDFTRGRVRQIGINLGATGDRKADDGLLWLDYPSKGGPSPNVPITLTGENINWFNSHPAFVEGQGMNWVAASGLEGAASISIAISPAGTLAKGRNPDGSLLFAMLDQPKDARYTVRLHFREPEALPAGARIFSVALQGQTVLKDFDIVKEAGGANRAIIKEFTDISIGEDLRIDLLPTAGSQPPVLCGVEARITEKPVDVPVSATFNLVKEGAQYVQPGAQQLLGRLMLMNPRTERALLDVEISGISLPPVRQRVEISGSSSATIECSLPQAVVERNEEITVSLSWGNGNRAMSSFALETLVLKKTVFPVTVDGDLREWTGHPVLAFNRDSQILPLAARKQWGGPTDLGAEVYLGWDSTNLYLAAQVSDDAQHNAQTGPDIWNGDALQFAFTSPAQVFSSLGLALLKSGPSAAQWDGPTPETWKNGAYAVVRDPARKVTSYEARIPLASLGLSATQGAGVGFNIIIFDDDAGKGMEYWYQLSPGLAGGGTRDQFKQFIMME